MKPTRYLANAFRGNPRALKTHAEALKCNPSIANGARILATKCACTPDDDISPVFLLSAGWRAGSTFLQRLIMSDSRVLIWGEPYDECGLIQHLSETMKAFRVGWPLDNYFLGDRTLDDLPEAWVANLFPSLDDWRAGHRAVFDAMFAEPSRRLGAARWGIKEVRLTADHCFYLRWLYPNARFVFLIRNPIEAYSSYYRHGRSWYDTFPDKPIFTAKAFGAHWRRLAESFVDNRAELDALLVRYEDLSSKQQVIAEVESYLSIRIDRDLINRKVGSSAREGKKPRISRLEKILLHRAVGPLAGLLGYTR